MLLRAVSQVDGAAVITAEDVMQLLYLHHADTAQGRSDRRNCHLCGGIEARLAQLVSLAQLDGWMLALADSIQRLGDGDLVLRYDDDGWHAAVSVRGHGGSDERQLGADCDLRSLIDTLCRGAYITEPKV